MMNRRTSSASQAGSLGHLVQWTPLHYYHPLVISLFRCLSSITHLLSDRRKTSFLHYFHHPVFLQPPPQCNIYSCSLAIQCTVTMSPVFVQARAENKTTLYPSSCKSHAALTSSEHQTVRKTGRWIIQPVRGPGCQHLTQRSSWFVSQKTSEDSQQAG